MSVRVRSVSRTQKKSEQCQFECGAYRELKKHQNNVSSSAKRIENSKNIRIMSVRVRSVSRTRQNK